MQTLYVSRKLLNGDEFLNWAESQGFKEHLEPDDLHVTIAFSKEPVDWSKFTPDTTKISIKSLINSVEPLGDKGAVVLKFKSLTLSDRWREFRDGGASWDYPSYQPHITICYNSNNGVDLNDVKTYNSTLQFGPEIFAPVDDTWSDKKK